MESPMESPMDAHIDEGTETASPPARDASGGASQGAPAPDISIRALLVDDDSRVLRSYSRLLRTSGIECEIASDGAEAERRVEQAEFDVVVTDILMPLMDGVELLRRIRERDRHLPVILMTGDPSVESAAKAVEYGAVRYLFKPIDPRDLVAAIRDAGRAAVRQKRARARSRPGGPETVDPSLDDAFSRALESLWMAYQPIVSWRERRVVAYEALCRTPEAAFPHPGALLDAAERLGRIHELGRRIRGRALEALPRMSDDDLLFINLHPMDLGDEALCADVADSGRVVLEVTERTALEGVADLDARIEALKGAGYRIAVDDLGAGYAGLTTFVRLTPSVVKLDMSLVRDIDKEPRKVQIVRGMSDLCARLGARVVVEGVETEAERDALEACGCDWMQGYLFAKPASELPNPRLS